MNDKQPGHVQAETGRPEKRSPRSIRFHDPEWERIEAFAETRGLAAAEFVRFAALAATGDDTGALLRLEQRDRLAPLIERTFRYSYMIVTKMRDDMREAGKDEELKALIDTARTLQKDLLADDPE